MARRLKIGEFADLTGLSVKTLRFYADEGLLPPARVDPASGYRFYDVAQVGDAARILNLREAGVSLADIRLLVAGDSAEVLAALRTQRAALLKERARIESRLSVVDGLIAAVAGRGPDAIAEMRIAAIEPEFVYTARARVDTASGAITEMFEDAERAVAAADARANRSPFLLIHDTDDPSAADVEVCIPVRDDRIDALPATLVSGAELACALAFAGGYAKAPGLARRMNRWLAEAGFQSSGPLREVYRRFGADEEGFALPKSMRAKSADRFVTELQLAIASPAEKT